MALTKQGIIQQVYSELGAPKRQSIEIVESLLEIIKATLASGDDLLVSGFGKFCVREKKKRRGRNIGTGENVTLPARRVVTFRCSGKLRDKVNADMITGSDRRRYPRNAAAFAVQYTVNSVTYRDLVRDVSAGGIYIGNWRAIKDGQRISLRFPLAALEKEPRVMGTVMRSQDRGFAVIFDHPIEEKICQTCQDPGLEIERYQSIKPHAHEPRYLNYQQGT
ncbi:MAG: HU family DNA-binding protein [Candidatus Competibacteraceae bacterium]|jgi:integration host factor subunit alpha|nr:HU family DNA-binding protein [Candidatus Competibacteraceae bacterium]